MNLLSLKYFIAITEYASFTKAAEHLYVTQPTLSRQIADLEEEFGVQLFVRHKRSISLTKAGKICLDEAKEIVSRCDALVNRLKNAGEHAGGTLHIGYLGFIENDLLTNPLQQLGDHYPNLNITLVRATLAELNHFLMEGEFDLIYTVAVGMNTIPNVRCTKIAKNPLQVVVPINHPLAQRDSIRVEELEHERFVMLERNVSPLTVDYIVNMCVNRGFSPSVVYYTKDAQTLLLMVGAGKGVAFLSSRMAAQHQEGVKFLDIEDCDIDFDIVLASKTNAVNPMIPLFLSQFEQLED